MIIPSVPCKIIAFSEEVDEYGQQIFAAPVGALCSVVRLTTSTAKTSVRTDSSGSGGNAQEIVADARLLFLPTTRLKENDRVEINGIALRVADINVRYAVFSPAPDHLEVDLIIWV